MTRSLLHGGLLAVLATVAAGCSSAPSPHSLDLRSLVHDPASGAASTPLSAPATEALPPIELAAPRPQKLEKLPIGVVPLRSDMVGVRAGALFPADSELATLDRPTFEFGIIWRHRMGGEHSHWSFETGLEWWRMKGSPQPNQYVELNKLTIPFTIGWNTRSQAEWSRNKANFFFGAGLQLTSVFQRLQQGTDGVTDTTVGPGYGFQVKTSLDIPMSDQGYGSILLRYDWSGVFNEDDLAEGLDDLGGFMFGAEIGFRF